MTGVLQSVGAWWLGYLGVTTLLLFPTCIFLFALQEPIHRRLVGRVSMLCLLALLIVPQTIPRELRVVGHLKRPSQVGYRVNRHQEPASQAVELSPTEPIAHELAETNQIGRQVAVPDHQRDSRIAGLSQIAGTIFLIVFAATSAWLLLGTIASVRLVLTANQAPTEMCSILRALCIGQRPPLLLISSSIPYPIVLAAIRPVIVLPQVAAKGLGRIESILRHELAHIRHHDLWWLAMSRLLLLVLVLNPLFWILRLRLRVAQERLADAEASQRSIHSYAEDLLFWAKLAAHSSRSLRIRGLGVIETQSGLARRIHALLHGSPASLASTRRCRISVLLVSILATGVLCIVFHQALDVRMAFGQQTTSSISDEKSAATLREANAQNPVEPNRFDKDTAVHKDLREALQRLEESLGRVKSYDIYVTLERKFLLMAEIVPTTNPEQPARKQKVQWRSLQPDESVQIDKKRYRQVVWGDGKRRGEKLDEMGSPISTIVFDGNVRRALTFPSKHGLIDNQRGIVDENDDYEEQFRFVYSGIVWSTIASERPSSKAEQTADGSLVIDLPPGEGRSLKHFGWKIFVEGQNTNLPKRIEMYIKLDDGEPRLQNITELDLRQVAAATWAPVRIIQTSLQAQAGEPHAGEATSVCTTTVDLERSRWNIDLPEETFVLAFPKGAEVTYLDRQVRFTVGDDQDDGRDLETLLSRASKTMPIHPVLPRKAVLIDKVAEDERPVVAALNKWHAEIELDNEGYVKSVSFPGVGFNHGYPGLDGVNMYDEGMVHIGKLKHLKSLGLEYTEVTDEGLKQIQGLTSLTELHLAETKISDTGLKSLEGLTNLKLLSLVNFMVDKDGTPIRRVRITDDGLGHLATLTNLEYLRLDGTEVTDAGLAQLKPLTKLKQLTLHRTYVTVAGVAKFRQDLPNLKWVGIGSKRAPSSN